jgi:hypothetical protein
MEVINPTEGIVSYCVCHLTGDVAYVDVAPAGHLRWIHPPDPTHSSS